MRSRWLHLTLAMLGMPGPLSGQASAQTSAAARPNAAILGTKDDRVQRRAIRGSALDVPHESAELRELRIFEEDSFPRATLRQSQRDPSTTTPEAPRPPGAELDLPPEGLRSPLSSNSEYRGDAATAATERPTIPWLQALKLLDNLGLSPTFVRFEAHVIRYLEYFKEERRGRSIMASWLRKQGRYRTLIEQALDRHGLPRFLLYVAMIESGYDPHDRSHKGAVGLWQFLPEGARIYGLRVDYWIDERKDPVRSTDAVARYLGDLKTRFGSWHMALAAFNAGYGAVLRAMQKYNTNDYWELCRHEDGLPWETLLYVPKAIASALVGENRGFFGYEDLSVEAPFEFDTIAIGSSLSLEKIARAVSSSVEELNRLNPELRRGRIPPLAPGETWLLRLPPGTTRQFLQEESKLRQAEPLRPHIVRFGERIEDIAREHNVSVSALRHINGLEERDSPEIRAGLTLLVPPSSTSHLSQALPADEIIVVAVPDKNLNVPGRQRVFYRVIAGDTIWAIARFFKVKEADLLRWNNIDPEATLATRLVLDIWVDPSFDTSQVVLVDSSRVRVVTTGSDEFFELVETLRGRKRIFHTLKAGETFEHLAKKYGLTVADIERINRLSRQAELQPGQKITIYTTMTAAERNAALLRLRGTQPAPGNDAAVSTELPRLSPAPSSSEETPPDVANEPAIAAPKAGPEETPTPTDLPPPEPPATTESQVFTN